MRCEDCSFFVDKMCTDDMEGYINKETGLSVCRYNPNAVLRETTECEFCKRERPLVLFGEYQACYNCMIRLRDTAPEMLSALEALYYLVSNAANPYAFDNGVYALDGPCEGDVLAGRVIEQARIAIAKAKGGK